jgi:hypothetical protein
MKVTSSVSSFDYLHFNWSPVECEMIKSVQEHGGKLTSEY